MKLQLIIIIQLMNIVVVIVVVVVVVVVVVMQGSCLPSPPRGQPCDGDTVDLESNWHTGVCETNIPFVRALAMQPSSRNPSLAPDSVFVNIICPRVLFSGGVFFHRHRYYHYYYHYYYYYYYYYCYYYCYYDYVYYYCHYYYYYCLYNYHRYLLLFLSITITPVATREGLLPTSRTSGT